MLEKGRRVVAGHQLARVRLFHAHLDASGGWVDFLQLLVTIARTFFCKF
jgi:hypothetical protein